MMNELEKSDPSTVAVGAKPDTDVASRKVADQGLGNRGEDVHAEVKKTPDEGGFRSRRPVGGPLSDGFLPILVSSLVNSAFLSLIEPFSYAQFAAGNISVGFTPSNALSFVQAQHFRVAPESRATGK
jgi:hypothetical protein